MVDAQENEYVTVCVGYVEKEWECMETGVEHEYAPDFVVWNKKDVVQVAQWRIHDQW